MWYFIGVVLANDGVRESAKGEYYQFLGTAFLVVMLLWGITAYSGLSYTILGSTKLMSPSAMSTLCGSIESGSTSTYLARPTRSSRGRRRLGQAACRHMQHA